MLIDDTVEVQDVHTSDGKNGVNKHNMYTNVVSCGAL